MTLKEKFWMICDILFVLILCFVVLLVTMLIATNFGRNEIFTGYTIHPFLLLDVIAAIVIYFAYMMKNSLKSLRDITHDMINKDAEQEMVEK